MMRMVVPWLQHTVSPSREHVVRMLQPLFADRPVDDEVIDTLGVIFQNVRIERRLPRPTDARELTGLDAPVLVIAAELDILFPASRVVPRAQEIIPNLYAAEQLAGSGHYPSPEDRQRISKRVAEFLS